MQSAFASGTLEHVHRHLDRSGLRWLPLAHVLPEVHDLIAQHGVDPEANTPEHFTQYVRDEYARWGKVIRAAGIKVE